MYGADLTVTNSTPEFDQAFAKAAAELRAEGKLVDHSGQPIGELRVNGVTLKEPAVRKAGNAPPILRPLAAAP
jgi:hypothetical protein